MYIKLDLSGDDIKYVMSVIKESKTLQQFKILTLAAGIDLPDYQFQTLWDMKNANTARSSG